MYSETTKAADDQLILGVPQMAKDEGVPERQMRYWVERGFYPHVRIGSKIATTLWAG